ncbi:MULTISPECIES: DUF4363 family protein [unclassified Clostridium]|uniref:DUF4363 family protein n=1 Tax=unclassified Clostridium TaxID=2614128 RepID=UPI00189866B6|nr:MULTISPECIES: DUF4363 family protein [unclassified Clostridium]MCR1952478.1 DUF4363 family protein [Clostridium sp. DSM 100503]
MKNSIISILLFIVLITGLFFLDTKFVSLCDDVMIKCEEIEDLLAEGEEYLAYESSVELLSLIKEKADIPAIYLNHVDYDSLMNESLKLTLYIKGEDKAESLATLHVVRYAAEHLKDLQKPNLQNLF